MPESRKQNGVRTGSRTWSLCAGLLLAIGSTACVDQVAQLEIADGSSVTIQPAGGTAAETSLAGNIGTRIQVAVDIAAALGGQPLNGTINADSLLIAGDSVKLG